MITVITLISNKAGLEILKRNLVSMESDWQVGLNLLCIVKDKSMFVECRNFLATAVTQGECLVVMGNSLKDGKDYVKKDKYVFLLGESVELPFGAISKLYKNTLEKPQAGFISGVFKQYPIVYWVKDIYGSPQYIYSNEKESYELLMGVDVSAVDGLLTKTSLYKELFCMVDLEGYGSYSYGIRLRRQGYKNYVNTGVEYKHGGEK